MIILGVDPGPVTSGVVAFSTETQRVAKAWPAMPNEAVLTAIREGLYDLLACECIESLYSGAGKETVRTILFTGRIIEAAETTGKPPRLLSPQAVRSAICGTAKAKDSGVRAALVDRFGGSSAMDRRKTCQKCNGKTYLNVRVPCSGCGETGSVPGAKAGTTKKCPTCKGRTDVAATEPCGCDGKQGEDGPLVGVSDHAWRALAVAYAVAMELGLTEQELRNMKQP